MVGIHMASSGNKVIFIKYTSNEIRLDLFLVNVSVKRMEEKVYAHAQDSIIFVCIIFLAYKRKVFGSFEIFSICGFSSTSEQKMTKIYSNKGYCVCVCEYSLDVLLVAYLFLFKMSVSAEYTDPFIFETTFTYFYMNRIWYGKWRWKFVKY